MLFVKKNISLLLAVLALGFWSYSEPNFDIQEEGLSKSDSVYKKVFFASYPRSGNTWTRYLIEESTHIATSTAGNKLGIKESFGEYAYPWGNNLPRGLTDRCRLPLPDDLVLMKTHYPRILEMGTVPPGNQAPVICIVRHPLDSIASFHKFQLNCHHDIGGFTEFAHCEATRWNEFYSFWMKDRNCRIVRYEDLLAEPEKVLGEILDIVGYEVTTEDIKRAVMEYPPVGSPLKHRNAYTQEDIEYIRRETAEVASILGYDII